MIEVIILVIIGCFFNLKIHITYTYIEITLNKIELLLHNNNFDFDVMMTQYKN